LPQSLFVPPERKEGFVTCKKQKDTRRIYESNGKGLKREGEFKRVRERKEAVCGCFIVMENVPQKNKAGAQYYLRRVVVVVVVLVPTW
jgi:hypothetical protein